jgi:CheY-like chemotaxis protein
VIGNHPPARRLTAARVTTYLAVRSTIGSGVARLFTLRLEESHLAINKVMLVDDDACIRRIGEISLTKVGQWSVTSCASAAAALESLEQQIPDVILLDVMMPLVDGVAVFPEIVRRTQGLVPIIFVTAKVMNTEVLKYLELGAAGVITKPFEPTSLPQEIEAIVASYHRAQTRSVCA